MSSMPCGCDPEAQWVSQQCQDLGECLSLRKRISTFVTAPQPPPVKLVGPCIQDLVIQDIEARKAMGLKKYGTLLQAHNGRDALVDAYQEALDLVQYLRQILEERNHVGSDRTCRGCCSSQ